MKKTLVVGPAWVGDMVMAQTLFKLLKQRQPDMRLDVLAPPWTKPLLDRMPEVNESIDSPFCHGQLHIGSRLRMGKQLRPRGYEHAIVLPNSFKSALVPFWAGIPRRTGWVGEQRYGVLNDLRKLDKSRLPLMVERFMMLGLEKNESLPEKPQVPALNISTASVAKTLQHLQLRQSEQPILALCPGAEFGPSKRWPTEYYAEVANEKLSEGWQVWLFGSAKDKTVTDRIDVLTDHRCVNLAGRTQLNEAVDLLSVATMVVTNDSGLMHIAAALGRPLVVMYGSTSPDFTPPLSDKVKILSLKLDCSPCFKRDCPFKHSRCMQDLKPNLVFGAMDSL